MPASITEFPDICSVIYRERTSIAGIYSKYIEELEKTSSRYNQAYANKLKLALDMQKPAKLREVERDFADFKTYMKKFTAKHNIHLVITKRQKDFIRYNNKIRYRLVNGIPLNQLRDFLGLRIVLMSPPKDTLESVNLCYNLLMETIDFFATKKSAIPMEASVVPESQFDSGKYPDIIVPEDNVALLGEYNNNVKDFIFHPTKNGYQSLHTVLEMQNGLTFEIQVRTFAMDVVAKYGSASHLVFEEKRRESTDICLDLSKVKIPGFTALPDGTIVDNIGLVKSINPFDFL